MAGYGGGSAIFGPLANLWLIPTYGWRSTFVILGVVFFFMLRETPYQDVAKWAIILWPYWVFNL